MRSFRGPWIVAAWSAAVFGLFLALTFIGGEQAQISMKIPLDLTKVFQGILLFYVLACDSLILYRIRLMTSRGAAHGTG